MRKTKHGTHNDFHRSITMSESLSIVQELRIASVVTAAISTLLAIVYLSIISCNKEFRSRSYLFTGNLATTYTVSSILSLLRSFPKVQNTHDNLNVISLWFILIYLPPLLMIEMMFSLTSGSLYRMLTVIYHTKLFVRKRRCVILLIVLQWIVGIILSIPMLFPIRVRDTNIHTNDLDLISLDKQNETVANYLLFLLFFPDASIYVSGRELCCISIRTPIIEPCPNILINGQQQCVSSFVNTA
jgi:hypothetical protein